MLRLLSLFVCTQYVNVQFVHCAVVADRHYPCNSHITPHTLALRNPDNGTQSVLKYAVMQVCTANFNRVQS